MTYYLLYRNDTLIANTSSYKKKKTNNLFTLIYFLIFIIHLKDNSYTDNRLLPFTTYSYRIQSFNSEGNTSSRPSLISITLPTQPCCVFEYRYLNVRSSKIDVQWTPPQRLNGINLLYIIKIFTKQNKFSTNFTLVEQTNSSVELEHNKLKLTSQNYFQVGIIFSVYKNSTT